MSGHGANAILLNKKNKDWTSKRLANHPSHPWPPTPYVRNLFLGTISEGWSCKTCGLLGANKFYLQKQSSRGVLLKKCP